MNINGRMHVVPQMKKSKDGHEFIIYRGTLSKHNKDDSYSYIDIDVKFAGATEAELQQFKTETRYFIDVKDGFISFRSWIDANDVEHKATELIVTKFEIINSAPITKKTETVVNDKKQ